MKHFAKALCLAAGLALGGAFCLSAAAVYQTEAYIPVEVRLENAEPGGEFRVKLQEVEDTYVGELEDTVGYVNNLLGEINTLNDRIANPSRASVKHRERAYIGVGVFIEHHWFGVYKIGNDNGILYARQECFKLLFDAFRRPKVDAVLREHLVCAKRRETVEQKRAVNVCYSECLFDIRAYFERNEALSLPLAPMALYAGNILCVMRAHCSDII